MNPVSKEEAVLKVMLNENDTSKIRLNQKRYISHIKEGGYFHICQVCGDVELAEYCDQELIDKLKEKEICHTCDFWINDILGDMDKRLVVRFGDGLRVYYDDGMKPEKRPFMGGDGAKWEYRKVGDEEVTISNDVWCNGDVPKHLEHLFEINCEVLVRS